MVPVALAVKLVEPPVQILFEPVIIGLVGAEQGMVTTKTGFVPGKLVPPGVISYVVVSLVSQLETVQMADSKLALVPFSVPLYTLSSPWYPPLAGSRFSAIAVVPKVRDGGK